MFNEGNRPFIEEFHNLCKKFQLKDNLSSELIGFSEERFLKHNSFTGKYLNDFVKYLYYGKSQVSCNAGVNSVSINANGDVFPCCLFKNLSFGNVFNNSIKEIWNSKQRQIFLKEKETFEEKCQNCSDLKFCFNWCLGDHYNKYQSFKVNTTIFNTCQKIKNRIKVCKEYRCKENMLKNTLFMTLLTERGTSYLTSFTTTALLKKAKSDTLYKDYFHTYKKL